MDFGALLHVAQKNSSGSKESHTTSRFYSTKFEPPKKETPKDPKLSANIQKFLAQQKEKELAKQREDKQKLDDLMAMRDTKSKNKIRKMLKVTKSANKSVLDDAVDSVNTAVTLQGPEQPDEDDYGYVSHEAGQMYRQMMDKFGKPEPQPVSKSRPQGRYDLSTTKARVREAINRDREEANAPRRRTITASSSTTSQSTSSSMQKCSSTTASTGTVRKRTNIYDPAEEKRREEQCKRDELAEKRRNRQAPPPPIFNFQAILKLAEQKQHQPIAAVSAAHVPANRNPDADRMLTTKERRELDERRKLQEERDRRRADRDAMPSPPSIASIGRIPKATGAAESEPRKPMEPNGRIPKLNVAYKAGSSHSKPTTTELGKPFTSRPSSAAVSANRASHKLPANSTTSKIPNLSSVKNVSTTSSAVAARNRSQIDSTKQRDIPPKVVMPGTSSASADARNVRQSSSSSSATKNVSANKPSAIEKSKSLGSDRQSSSTTSTKTRQFPPADVKPRKLLPDNAKTRQFPPADVQKTRQQPIAAVKTRLFPPSDLRGGTSNNQLKRHVATNGRQPQSATKRPRVIQDDDSEYDSEMDDFIDDDDMGEDYSKHIKEIFGYDKSRYRHLDDDCDNMESSFAQQMREEQISKKIGLMEDLEDMRLEAEEKKAKAKKRGSRSRLADSDED